MHIRKDKSDIFGSDQNIAKSDILGSTKNKTMFMVCFYTKHRYTDISGFVGGNPDFYLHCFKILYVHVQVSEYKMS